VSYTSLVARVREVLEQALELPVKQRARIARELLASLDEGPEEDPAQVERVWAAEIQRRVGQIRTGKEKGIPWTRVRRELRADLAGSRRGRARHDSAR
jgi:putative addiction module component (TIGR02574 family)